MSRFSAVIAKYPVATLVIVLLISAGMIGLTVTKTSFETSEEDFNPDSEIADANREVMDNYAQDAYFVQVIAVSDDDDILTKECMMDILSLEENISLDPDVQDAILPSPAFPTGISSIADIVLLLNDLYMGLDQINMGLDLYSATVADTVENLEKFILFLETQVKDDNLLEKIPEIIDLTSSFAIPEDNRTQENSTVPNIIKMSNLETEDIKNILFDTLNFNKGENGQVVLDKSGEVLYQLETFELTHYILNNTINTIKAYPNASVEVNEEGQTTIEILDSVLWGITAASEKFVDVNTIVGPAYVIYDYLTTIGEQFPQFLSKEFDPDVTTPGELAAEATFVMIQLDGGLWDVNDGKAIEKVEIIIQDITKDDSAYSSTDMKILAMGLITQEIGTGAQSEMMRLMGIALILILVILAITYRSITDMFISFVAIILAITWTFGFAAIMGWPFNTIVTAVPILIIGLGIDYGIHLTLRYREEEAGSNSSSREESVKIAIFFVGSALVLATVTTCLSFLSNLTSEMGLIRRFGVLAAVGIVSSFLIMVTFVPSVKQLIDGVKEKRSGGKKKEKKKTGANGNSPQKYFSAIGKLIVAFIGLGATFAKKSSVAVIVVALLITGISLFGAMQLETRFEFEDFLPEDSESSDNFRYAVNHFDMSTDNSYVLIKGDDLGTYDVLVAINSTMNNIKDDEYVDGTDIISVIALIKDVSTDERSARPTDLFDPVFKQMCDDNCSGGGFPDNNINAILTYLYNSPMTKDSARMVMHPSDDTKDFSVMVFDGMLITVGTKTNLVERGDDVQRELIDDHEPLDSLEDDGTVDSVIVTGGMVMTKATMDAMTRSQYRSIGITVLISAVLLTIVFLYEKKSFVLGLITTIPIVFVISWILGGMFLLGYKLNVLTITVGSLTIGLGVTYAIHITHRYLEELDRQRDVDKALKKCLENTGLALFAAAATTVGGFVVLVWSTMPPMQQFGTITAMAITFSMISSIFILPSMLRIWARVREDKGTLYKDEPVEDEEPEDEEDDIIQLEIAGSKPVATKKSGESEIHYSLENKSSKKRSSKNTKM